MKIAYFAEQFPSRSETWIHREIECLQGLGCQVRVYATWARPENIPNELRKFAEITTYKNELHGPRLSNLCMVVRSAGPMAAKGLVTDARGLRQKCQVIRDLIFTAEFIPDVSRFNPDFLFAHFAGTRTSLCLFMSLATKTLFGFKMHAADIWKRTALFERKMQLANWKGIISEFGRSFLERTSPDVRVDDVHLHSCGLPLEQFPFSIRPLDSSAPTILTVGRLVPMKGFDVLIRAVKSLIDEGICPTVRIIGYGPEQDKLARLVADLALGDMVQLLGYQPPEAVKQELRRADLFVLPSVWDKDEGQDGVPTVLMEAMAMGVPVVSTRLSGIPELVEEGVSGVLCEPGDAAALADAILSVIRIPEEQRSAMAAAARAKIERDHDAMKQTRILLGDLTRLVQDRQRGSGMKPTV